MESPISTLLRWQNNEETRPLKMGGEVFQVTVPESIWWDLDRLAFGGYDVDGILDYCAANLIDDDPSRTLHQYVYWIFFDDEALLASGLQLRSKSGNPVLSPASDDW